LQLFGSRHKPFYRVVAIDAHNKRNGKFLEILGSVANFLRRNIFSKFGRPRTIISDGGSHFYNKIFHVV
ncbi:MAG: 30S ribosomal protein S16, partial [Candidatus Phytoplasma australasiaticum]|nr:30S ribosomal protein S16 [Candidatus Phytoplasma australasiaticum]